MTLPIDQIICGDALEALPTISDNSVSLIVTDPPYYRVKPEAWDRQWSSPEEYLEWLGLFCEQWHRILKPNGSLYCFASPQMAARVECLIAEVFTVVNRITWRKGDFDTKAEMFRKSDLRSYFPASEAIIFAQLAAFLFESLRAYLNSQREAAGFSIFDVTLHWRHHRGQMGNMPYHWFTKKQWELPTADAYVWLRQLFNDNAQRASECLCREYKELQQEHEDLRRPFTVTAEVPYTDVWDFPTVKHYPGKHPCEKPLAMIEHIVRASSREGDVVLDCFAGSGVVAEACYNLGRHYILVEREPKWCDIAKARIEYVKGETTRCLFATE